MGKWGLDEYDLRGAPEDVVAEMRRFRRELRRGSEDFVSEIVRSRRPGRRRDFIVLVAMADRALMKDDDVVYCD